MNRLSHTRQVTLTALAVVILCSGARATTFVAMSEEDLTHSSGVIVLGDVQAITTDSGSAGDIHTAVTVAVQEQIKGMPQGMVVLTIPGGTAGDVRRVVYGTPQFFLGERVVVFLHQRADGTLLPTGLAMGKYSVLQRATGAVARRQLAAAGTAVLKYDKFRGALVQSSGIEERPLDDFLDHLRGIVASEPPTPVPTPSVSVQPSPQSRFGAAFTLLGPPPARWTEPDAGSAVLYTIDPTGDRALGAAASFAAVHSAFAAWSGAGSALTLADAGPAMPAPFQACDGRSTIQFNDPFGEIGAPSNCAGVLAIGGFCSTGATTSTVHGTTFARITEGDITVNDGLAGCPYWTAINLAEVLTHELGHTIGLAHSSENPNEPDSTLRSATMYYLAHFDGRGAALRSDDILGVRALYPAAIAPSDVRMRTLFINGDTLVLNAIVHFPPSCRFQPTRDAVAIELRGNTGVLYSGTVHVRSLRQSTRRPSFTGPISDDSSGSLLAFTWLRSNSATLILRVRSPQLAAAANGPATLSLQFGQYTLVQQFTLLQHGDGTCTLA